MLKVYTLGHNIPEKVKEVVEEWDYWAFMIVSNSKDKNKDVEFISKYMNAREWRDYQTKDGLTVKVGYIY